MLCDRTGTISAGDYLLAVGDVWLDSHSLEEAAHVLTAADKVVRLRIQKNECYAGSNTFDVRWTLYMHCCCFTIRDASLNVHSIADKSAQSTARNQQLNSGKEKN